MAEVFCECNLFPAPYGNHYTLIKLLLWIAKLEGPFPSVGRFIYCVCSSFHCARNLSSLEYIVPNWLENLKFEQPMLFFPSSMDQQETKAILGETGTSSWATLLGLCKERPDFSWMSLNFMFFESWTLTPLCSVVKPEAAWSCQILHPQHHCPEEPRGDSDPGSWGGVWLPLRANPHLHRSALSASWPTRCGLFR